MAPLKKEQPASMQDIYNLPESQRAELISGKLFMMAPPKRIHQGIVGNLYFEIERFIQEKKLSCEAYIAPFGV